MGHPPVVSRFRAGTTPADRRRCAALAEALQREQPGLAPAGEFAALRTRRLAAGPVLHLDDLSGVSLPDSYGSLSYLEDRARLRASDGDLVATRVRRAEGYEAYCRDRLGLGSVRWLRVRPGEGRRHLATGCWIDPRVRTALRRADLRYIHPHMGNFAVWALADLLRRSTGRMLSVVAPPPSLTRAVNNKLWFADVVARLLGKRKVPRTRAVSNHLTMAWVLREFSEASGRVVVKLPEALGGGGNLVLDSDRLRGQPLGRLRRKVKALLAPLEWQGETRLLVSSWEEEVLKTPSAQLWIPPLGTGSPQVEGLFEQVLEGREGLFIGSRPARLPEHVAAEIVDDCWLLGHLFQLLGYVGRCSFDLLLVGADIDDCRIEFVECNGRWGGTSLPMTLMTRLFGDWSRQPFACLQCEVPSRTRPVDRRETRKERNRGFPLLLERLEPSLFDATRKEGRLILYNPAGLTRGNIDVAGLGQRFHRRPSELSRRVGDLLRRRGPKPAPGEGSAADRRHANAEP